MNGTEKFSKVLRSFYVDEGQYRELERLAADTDVSVGSLVRKGVAAVLGGKLKTQSSKLKTTTQNSKLAGAGGRRR
ncbi:MAG: hypothetical protein LBK60_01450 [Verrucomicrobiales bacterium]|jgi:16S rRNA U516 pseudouridylate synthase RsuA-like enzyme|nr:hypothetical protein [Verrucomicrobiales bacterium]